MRNASAVIDGIHASYGSGSKHGLKNTLALMSHLGLAVTVPVIHVAGTNGKGSTCAMLESVLHHAGYRTGLYTSPFLQVYNERIRINGVPVEDALIEKHGNPVLDAAEALRASEDIHATPFELGTVLALRIFEEEKVDVAIVEVGMGGRLDPTNVVAPRVCAITAIGMDHMQFLGNTVEEIAGEKAGIIKPGVPVIAQPAQESVAAVFARRAQELAAPLTQLQDGMIAVEAEDAHGSTITAEFAGERISVRIPLPGAHQQRNAMTVLAVCGHLAAQGFALAAQQVTDGIAAAKWPARLEWCGNILLDGAHNAQGVAALQNYVHKHLADKCRVLLTGVLTEKLDDDMLTELASLGDEIITVTPDSPRAMTGATLAERFAGIGRSAHACGSLREGIAGAKALAGADGVIIAAGSLYLMGELRTVLELGWK